MAARCWRNPTKLPEMVQAVTHYVARRLVERERALADDAMMGYGSVVQADAAGAPPRALARARHVCLSA